MTQSTYATDKFSIINSLPLFSGLSFLQKRFVAARSRIAEFKKGDIVYQEDEPPDFFYCMANGRVRIYHPVGKSSRPRELTIEYVRKGDYFGSISSLTGQPHSVSAQALNDSVLLKINTKDFNYILRRIPQLAILLSRSLSRRLSRKGVKKIFQSTIIAVYALNNGLDSSRYATALKNSLLKQSGKKARVIRSASITAKQQVSPRLSSFTRDYHYVLVDIAPVLNDVNFEILKQADICYILSSSDRRSLGKVSVLLKRLEGSFSKHARPVLSVLLKEDRFYRETSYADKAKILSKEIFATIPSGSSAYKKLIRRIARETSGVMVGLTLGSGAAMGFAHIGVLKVLEQEKIPIDAISAASMGALVAALWAGGLPAGEIEKLACGFKSRLKTLFLIDPVLSIRGLIKGRTVRKILKDYLGDKTFFDLKLPLKIVACDINRRKEFIIDKGSLIDAVMASIAIPGVFEPVKYNSNIQLVDGGIVNPLPVNVLSKSGIKRIIAVNTLPSPEDLAPLNRKRLNIYGVIVNSLQAMEFTMASHSGGHADVYLHPVPKLANWYEFYKARLFIRAGQDHTKRMLGQIKTLTRPV